MGGPTVKARDLRGVDHVGPLKYTFSLRHGDESACYRRDGMAVGDVVEGDALLLVLRQLVDQPGPLKTRIPERHGGPGQVDCTWVSAIVVVRPMGALHRAFGTVYRECGRAESRVGLGLSGAGAAKLVLASMSGSSTFDNFTNTAEKLS